MHDFKIRKLENKRGNRILDKFNVRIYADSVYQGMQKMFQNSKVSLSKKRRKNQELTDTEKQDNQVNARARVPIEHTIGHMKKFKILGSKYRGKLGKNLHLKLINIAGLVNLVSGIINS